jgi:RNA polymerase sigma-70 factor (ECF subfamily)
VRTQTAYLYMLTTQQDSDNRDDISNAHFDFQKKLNTYASFKVHSVSMGEDLVQDTFIKTLNYLVKGGKIVTMKAFLYHVLNGLIIDEYRKHKTTSLDTLIEKGFDPGTTSTSDNLFDTIDGKTAMNLINRLPVKYQKVMKMKYFQLLTLKEISILTQQTKNTIAVQLHRGLSKLKLLYDHGNQ